MVAWVVAWWWPGDGRVVAGAWWPGGGRVVAGAWWRLRLFRCLTAGGVAG